MMTAHAPGHVTCRQGLKNDQLFEIPEATLPIHYATFMGVQRRLRAIYRRKFYTGVFLAENFKVRFWAHFSTLGEFFRD